LYQISEGPRVFFSDLVCRDLWAGVVAAPADWQARLVLADRLEECGEDPQLAEHIRLQTLPVDVDPEDEDAVADVTYRMLKAEELLDSRHALTGARCREAWTWPLRRAVRGLDQRLAASGRWLSFRRGLVEAADVPVGLWVVLSNELRAAAPLTRVTLRSPLPWRLSPFWRQLDAIASTCHGLERLHLAARGPVGREDLEPLASLPDRLPGTVCSWRLA
jgi:uncharacterized protein (TIGR02996 family)